MIEETLTQIKDEVTQDRELLIDELCDLLENNRMSDEDQRLVVFQLASLLKTESNENVIESIFNLFGFAIFNSIYSDYITEISIAMLPDLKPGSLIHALSIIGESNLPNKKEYAEPYLLSDNPAIKEAAHDLYKS
jgi:hypothetical protein